MQYLYLIKCQQFYKIGIANDVESRLAQLSTGNPFQLQLINVYGFENAEVVEKAIHQRFSSDRVRGEWFEIPNVNLDLFGEICEILGGVRVSSHATGSSDFQIEEAEAEAEEIGEYLPTIEDVKRIMGDLNYRLEYRYNELGIRGFAWRLRTGNKTCPLYIGKRNPIFNQVKEMLQGNES